jgi:hypothetical protein
MTDPQIAIMMLGIFILVIMLGFPIAFTLMAMGIGFGYYAYYDPSRMRRSADGAHCCSRRRTPARATSQRADGGRLCLPDGSAAAS